MPSIASTDELRQRDAVLGGESGTPAGLWQQHAY